MDRSKELFKLVAGGFELCFKSEKGEMSLYVKPPDGKYSIATVPLEPLERGPRRLDILIRAAYLRFAMRSEDDL